MLQAEKMAEEKQELLSKVPSEDLVVTLRSTRAKIQGSSRAEPQLAEPAFLGECSTRSSVTAALTHHSPLQKAPAQTMSQALGCHSGLLCSV